MPKYTVNVSWSMFGSYTIEAESPEEAENIVWKNGALPLNGEYIEDSFHVDSVEIEP